MKQPFSVDGITYFFILLFVYTGVEKFTEISAFKDQLVASPLLGSIVGFVTWALPVTEIVLVIALFVPRCN